MPILKLDPLVTISTVNRDVCFETAGGVEYWLLRSEKDEVTDYSLYDSSIMLVAWTIKKADERKGKPLIVGKALAAVLNLMENTPGTG